MKNDTARIIPGFTRYVATEDGSIVSRKSGRVLATCLHRTGYYTVSVWNDARGKDCRTSLHRLILLAYEGPKPTPRHVCRHLNGDRLDNRPANLRWGTQKENMADAVRHGTHPALNPSQKFLDAAPQGEKNGNAKLTEAQVLEIEQRSREGETSPPLAAEFGVSGALVRDIRAHKAWRHLWAEAS